MFYPQFDVCPPPEPFFSWAGGRKRRRVQMISFLGLHAVTPHELLEEHGGPQMTSSLTQIKVSQHMEPPQFQKSTAKLIWETVNPRLRANQAWSRPTGRKLLL